MPMYQGVEVVERMKHKTLAREFLDVAAKERIEAIVIDEREEPMSWEPSLPAIRPMSWEEAEPLLAKLPNDRFASTRAYAWTATRVLFVHEYDSSFSIYSVPRNPIPCVPGWCGHPEWIEDE